MQLKVPRTAGARAQSGVGLIEVLIAVLIMAVGLLGVAALQATALRNSQSSLERSQAVVHSYAILDAMRANLGVTRAGGYNTGMVCDFAGGGSLANDDRAAWFAAMHEGLGNDSCGQIQCTPVPNSVSRNCVVTVRWNDSRAVEGEEQFTISTETRI